LSTCRLLSFHLEIIPVGDRTQEIKRKRPEQNNGCPLISVERSGGQRQKSRDRTQEIKRKRPEQNNGCPLISVEQWYCRNVVVIDTEN
jgi:hypothetical protein